VGRCHWGIASRNADARESASKCARWHIRVAVALAKLAAYGHVEAPARLVDVDPVLADRGRSATFSSAPSSERHYPFKGYSVKHARYAGRLLAVLCCAFPAIAAEPPNDANLARWQREDIEVFRNSFMSLDRSFTTEARKTADARLTALVNARESLPPVTFAVELCRIAALADNGHTQCMSPRVGRIVCERFADLVTQEAAWCKLREPDFTIPEFVSLPIGFYPFSEEFHVTRVSAEHEDLLGARLLTVDGRAVADMRAELRTFSGGTPAYRDIDAARVLASPTEMQAVGLAQQSGAITYEFALHNGQRVKRKLSVPQQTDSEIQWRRLPPADKAPWTLREPEKPFRFRDAPEAGAVVIQLRQVLDNGDDKIGDFLVDAEHRRQQLSRDNVILDMRENGGGNLLLIREFMSDWPRHVPGRFYVLTSRETFSAAIASIGYLKQAGKERVVIVGEPIGDRLMFFSDGLPVQLPHSGLFFLPAVLRMDYADGCRKYDDCFEAVAQPGGPAAPTLLKLPPNTQRLPIAVKTLDPDVIAPWTIQSWIEGLDPAMEAVVALRKDGRGKE
jgi:hypothetical protein